MIHPLHRRMAEILYMSTSSGETLIGDVEIKLLLPLLHQNMRLIQQLDNLKQLSFIAYMANDFDWQHDLCARIEALGGESI